MVRFLTWMVLLSVWAASSLQASMGLPFEVRPLSNFWIWMSENDPNRAEWVDLTIGSIGVSAQYTASINNYSIREGRNKLGVTLKDNEYSYVQHSVSVLVDFLIGLDYKEAGAR